MWNAYCSLSDRFQRSFSGRAEAAAVHANTLLDQGIPIPATKGYRRPVEFRVLGSIEVFEEGNGSITLGGPKQQVVLAHLLLRANHLVPADVLIDEVWGEEPPVTARNALQSYASHLRKALGAERLEGSRAGYRLRAEPSELDATRFQSLVRDARRLLPIDAQAAVGAFDRALALWRGPAFADLATEPSLRAEAARLEELRLGALEDRIEAQLAIGQDAEAIGELEGLTARHPLRERFWEQLMLALYRSGRQGEALTAYQRVRELLADELGIDPSPELRRLQQRILAQSPELDAGGEPLRGYRLLERLGEDASGVVYRATQPNVGREVAIRVVHEHRANDPAFIRRFDAEAQAVAMLEHQNVAAVYDYWREPGRAYVVTRFLRGGSLRDLLDHPESLQAERASRILEQVGSALAAAHRRGVGHGDVRASNVLFDEEGNAYLADFSIGRGSAGTVDDVEAFAALTREMLDERAPMAVEEALRRVETARGHEQAPVLLAEVIATLGSGMGEPAVVAADIRNPYKGLRPFLEADAGDFFGREAFIESLLDRMSLTAGARFIAVVGASGSGKSSVVRGGLVAAIRRGAIEGSDRWFVTEMVPGHHPLEELDAALMRVAIRPPAGLLARLESGPRGLVEVVDAILPEGTELLLVVDQLEEVFTLTESEDDRALLLESLRVATAEPSSRLRVVATLRADFYDRPLRYPRIGQLLASTTEVLSALTPEELERAIVRPAERAGLSIDGGVVPQIAADVAEQPGALPLVQYALTELYDRREEGRLTLEAYRDIGGVGGALAASAEHLYATRQPAGRNAVRQLFLRLVTLGEGAADTRRRVTRSELSTLEVDASTMDSALHAYGRHRLLTFDRDPATREPTVEVAHEALLSAWERLGGWIDKAREDVRINRRLSDAAHEWERNGREPSFLLSGSRLEQFESWGSATNLALGLEERGYLSASVARRDEERAAEDARTLRERMLERRSVKRLQALVVALTAAALVAGTLTAIALNRNASAQRASRVAAARELLTAAAANFEIDRQFAILLGLEAARTTQDVDGTVLPEVEQFLRRAAPAVAIDTTLILGSAIRGGSATPDGSAIALVDEAGSVGVWDLRNGSRILALPSDTVCDSSGCPEVFWVSLSDDAHLLATGDGDGLVHLWDLRSGREVVTVSTDTTAFAATFGGPLARPAALSPDGRLLATGGRDGFRMWDVATGTQAGILPRVSSPWIVPRFSPDGTWLFYCALDDEPGAAPAGHPGAVNVITGETMVFRGGFFGCGPQFSADSTRVALLLLRGSLADATKDPTKITWHVEMWDLRLRKKLSATSQAEIVPVASAPGPTALSPDGVPIALSPDGEELAVVGGPAYNVVELYDADTLAPLRTLEHTAPVNLVGFSQDGTRIATVSDDGAARVWNTQTGALIFTSLDESSQLKGAAFNQDGSRIALLYSDGRIVMHAIALEDVIEIAKGRVTRSLTDAECRRYLHVQTCPTD
jgi:DNA-binding SARP family transcriptional activator/tRNA A-37 threonylcarbamoyl transferase component Bud32